MIRSDRWTLADLMGTADQLRHCCVAAVNLILPEPFCAELEILSASEQSTRLLTEFPADAMAPIKHELVTMLTSLVGERSVPARLAEFVAGRYACQLAQELVASEQQLPAMQACPMVTRDVAGRPIWPAGLTGSITHTKQTRHHHHHIAAMAILSPHSEAGMPALGIDLESFANSADNPITHELIAGQAEFDLFRSQLPIGNDALFRAILLSLKEAIYKTLEPLDSEVGRRLDFRSACLQNLDRSQHLPNRLLPEASVSFGWTCTLDLTSKYWPNRVTGRCLVSPAFVLSICEV